MNLPIYEEYEAEFLEGMATRLCFSGKTKLAFVQRLLEGNNDLEDNDLAEVLETDLIKGTKEGDAVTILRDQWGKAICPKLAVAGCDFNDTKRGKWKIAKRWLREDKFPEWCLERDLPPLEQLWQRLREKATLTDKMGPIIHGTLDMFSHYEKCVRLGSSIRFEVNFDEAGYLTLLDKGTSGSLWCLCPSSYASEPYMPDGKTILPQKEGKSFKITGNVGKEQVVAVITKELPDLDWLPKEKQSPLEMDAGHLQELVEYLHPRADARVFYMEYTVTA